MQWFKKAVFENYWNFKGRARRKEYWMFILIQMLISLVLTVIDTMFNLTIGDIGLLGAIYSLFLVVPTFSVLARRLHDRGMSAWWILLILIPLAGSVALIVICALDGTKGTNQYGNDPKEETLSM